MKTKALKWLNSQVNDGTTVEQLNIIKFIKKCINDYKREDIKKDIEDYIAQLFDKFYKIYCRKGSKQQAYKTFRKKLIKLKTKEEVLDKARNIVKLYIINKNELEGRDYNYQPLCSTWINSNIPD